jgi:cytochrome c553
MMNKIAASLLFGALVCTQAYAQQPAPEAAPEAAPAAAAPAPAAPAPEAAPAPATPAPAGDIERAKTKISMCVGCHGIQDYRTAYPEVYSVPYIAGQSQEYIVAALKAYKSGDRNHPSMRGIARSLSEQDVNDLAAYYAAGK